MANGSYPEWVFGACSPTMVKLNCCCLTVNLAQMRKTRETTFDKPNERSETEKKSNQEETRLRLRSPPETASAKSLRLTSLAALMQPRASYASSQVCSWRLSVPSFHASGRPLQYWPVKKFLLALWPAGVLGTNSRSFWGAHFRLEDAQGRWFASTPYDLVAQKKQSVHR